MRENHPEERLLEALYVGLRGILLLSHHFLFQLPWSLPLSQSSPGLTCASSYSV